VYIAHENISNTEQTVYLLNCYHYFQISCKSIRTMAELTNAETQHHLGYLQQALSLAKLSPPKETNYCVGAVLVNGTSNQVISTGYTLELEGNTHAEQCCLTKLATEHNLPEEQVGQVIPTGSVLYTTMEPCALRLSGNLPCVQRILGTAINGVTKIGTVVCGVQEPEKFVGENKGRKMLEDAGVHVLYVTGLEDEILAVATAGHKTE
jgi:pyrimidine deaminase RibD-like protein